MPFMTNVSAAVLAFLTGAAAPTVPEPGLTPGAVRTTSAAVACARPLPPRPDEATWLAAKRQVMRAYFHRSKPPTGQEMRLYELDHLIPRELGGADDIRNLWPEPWPEARRKDRIENEMTRDFCRNDRTDAGLEALQRWFAAGKWREKM